MKEQLGTTESQLAFSELTSEAKDKVIDHYYQQWLEKHRSFIPGLLSAQVQVMLDDAIVVTASLNEGDDSYAALVNLSQQELQSEQPQVAQLAHNKQFALLYPLRDEQGQFFALVSMAIEVDDQQGLQQALSLVQWSVAGLEVIEYQQRLQKIDDGQQDLSDRVDILARVLAEPSYPNAVIRLVTELAVLFNCDRVSLGEYKNKACHLKHLSHSTQFGKKMNLTRAIEKTMDECLDQGKVMTFPVNDQSDSQAAGADILLAHQLLSESQGDSYVLSIPIYLAGSTYGAMVLEANPQAPLTQQQINACQGIVHLVMPALEDKRISERPLWKVASDSSAKQLSRLLGAGYLGRKLLFIFVVAVVGFLSSATGEYRLSTDAMVESAIQRAIVSPYDGYIQSASARAGDTVEQGQILVTMDDRDLRLERLKWLTEQAKLNRQYQEALALRDRAKINIINAQAEQVKAQINLVSSQLERGQLVAPFDGFVIDGDLSQRLGSAVSKGDGLLMVAPQDNYRLKMLVRESRIADIELGQQGNLLLSALPEQNYSFSISKLTPLTISKDGQSYFIVEGEFTDDTLNIEPGMEGIGKIYIDNRALASIWFREATEWMRLKVWSWWG
ncbi:HlyD family efflux transporter periplasmic adaptor subunit [Vibrio sp. 99-8-1]|uniref:HlyD family efflux transporter periplasmic adaptor subunit n=1 Tax=Vibrio sp. 99-8-1 TaxID=2607602 RepID=UPI0014938CBA|nr:HlyD family efflux transporter periplasmic adaptor subunit [Vibrio sp. 99-8-1]NOI65299.1 HlyD family efflux transporter periplasmic adaptor subunit [Vibrio sp. 99-8-1]